MRHCPRCRGAAGTRSTGFRFPPARTGAGRRGRARALRRKRRGSVRALEESRAGQRKHIDLHPHVDARSGDVDLHEGIDHPIDPCRMKRAVPRVRDPRIERVLDELVAHAVRELQNQPAVLIAIGHSHDLFGRIDPYLETVREKQQGIFTSRGRRRTEQIAAYEEYA
jgi:hypothetical protein